MKGVSRCAGGDATGLSAFSRCAVCKGSVGVQAVTRQGAAAQIFIRYLPACGMTLYYNSLVGGFSAPKITQVAMLPYSGRPKSPRCSSTPEIAPAGTLRAPGHPGSRVTRAVESSGWTRRFYGSVPA